MKRILMALIALFVIATSICGAQNPLLIGVTQAGGGAKKTGGDSIGTLFRYNTAGSGFKNLFPIPLDTIGEGANSDFGWNIQLMQASNGLLYGFTNGGGGNGEGTIFSYNISTGKREGLYSFYGTDSLFASVGPLIEEGGNLYGMAQDGGKERNGAIYSYGISTHHLEVLYSFDSICSLCTFNDGSFPESGFMEALSGLLYGTTSGGGATSAYTGASGGGTLFSFNVTTDSETILHNFGSGGTDGLWPDFPPIQLSDLLYGTTGNGGAGGNSSYYGTLYSYDIKTGIETVIHSFGSGSEGYAPNQIIAGDGGKVLYGTTVKGSTNSKGALYSYDISTGVATVLHSFASSSTDGEKPVGPLVLASNGVLYGVTEVGGTDDHGTLFSYNPSGDIYTIIYNFTTADGSGYGPVDLIEVLNGLSIVNQPTLPPTGGLKAIQVTGKLSGPRSLLLNAVLDTQTINESSANENVNVYPNPTTGQFTINYNGNQNGCTLQIYNVLGEEVYQSILSNSQNIINLSNQPAGIYFVHLKSDDGVEVGKVLITR